MKQAEIRKNGYKALIDSLGVVGMLRFLQQLEIGSGDYTLERHQASEPTLEEFRQFTNTVSRVHPTFVRCCHSERSEESRSTAVDWDASTGCSKGAASRTA